jgi:hypothetical protein
MVNPTWLSLFWLFNPVRRWDEEVNEADQILKQAPLGDRQIEAQIRELSDAIDKLILITRAMWEITAKEKGLTDEDLINKVNEIDLRDGKADGRITPAIRQCPSCGRNLFVGHRKCLYCGSEDVGGNPFEVK